MRLTRLSLVVALALSAAGADMPELQSPGFRFVPAYGLGLEHDVCRRDPSDVIKVDSVYYVWYTKVRNTPGIFEYPSGYSGSVWYATSEDGSHWTERGESVTTGGRGSFDENGVFTPGILVAGGKYYLFFDAVPKPMTALQTPTFMGIAIADSPRGPWKKFTGNPVFAPSKDPGQFDSYRVDDSCLITRDGKYWLYYKGRQKGHSPGETKWGVAMATKPTGPYVRYEGNPVVGSGHEVLIWPHREGVAALVGPTGPDKNTIQYAPDGLHFSVISHFQDPPKAPGAFRPDAFDNTRFGKGIQWGISMVNGKDPYLVRYECDFAVANPSQRMKTK